MPKVNAATQRAIDDLYARHRERGAAIFIVPCDGGCGAVFEGTARERRKAGWAFRWRQKPGTDIEVQIDLCSSCKKTNVRAQGRPLRGSHR